MRLRYRTLVVLFGLVLVSCAGHADRQVTHGIIRPGLDLPDHFLIDTDAEAMEPTDDGTCHSPLVDPRDGTKLTMIRSANGMGDYAPPDGRYGVGTKELLRIECATGVAIGIVQK